MTKPHPEPKKHHYVPQSLLRRFSISGGGARIFVFDKTTQRSFAASILNAGSENGYNKAIVGEAEWNFEALFQDLDDDLAAAVRDLHQRRSLAGLSEEERSRLADVVAVLFLRTPMMRSTLQAVPRDLLASLAEAGFDVSGEADGLPGANEAKLTALQFLAGRERLRAALLTKDLVLYTPSGGARFWVSDHPVIRANTVPNGSFGFEARGVEVYVPLGSELMVGFLCPSVRLKLTERPLERLELESARATRLIELREGLLSGDPVALEDELVERFNARQVSGSRRFVYAAADDFQLARAMLERAPELATVPSLVQVGRMGEGPGPAPSLPDGQFLVLHGRSSWHLVPVSGWDPEAKTITARTDRPDVVALAREDQPFELAELYVDRVLRRGIRQVRVLSQPAGGGALRLTIEHSSPDLRALDRAIARRGPQR